MIIKNGIKIPEFSKGCFWDLDSEKINYEDDKRFVIARVVSRGSTKDQQELFGYYGWNTIKNEVVNIIYLNKKILNYLSILFEIDQKEFKAYNNKDIF